MSPKLNHTIVAARDRKASALFLSEILGLEIPRVFGPFVLVKVGDELTLDFIETQDQIKPQHYAFLVSETEFEQIFARLQARQLPAAENPHPLVEEKLQRTTAEETRADERTTAPDLAPTCGEDFR